MKKAMYGYAVIDDEDEAWRVFAVDIVGKKQAQKEAAAYARLVNEYHEYHEVCRIVRVKMTIVEDKP